MTISKGTRKFFIVAWSSFMLAVISYLWFGSSLPELIPLLFRTGVIYLLMGIGHSLIEAIEEGRL